MLTNSISDKQVMRAGQWVSIFDIGRKLSSSQRKTVVATLHQRGMEDVKSVEFYDYRHGELSKHLFIHMNDGSEKRYFELSDSDIQTLFKAIIQVDEKESNGVETLLY